MSVQGNLEYGKFSDRLREEILKELLALANQITGLAKQYAPEATTHLRGSIDYLVREASVGIAVEVGSPVEYGAYVEFGTKPHWISREGFDALVRWVDEKQLDRISRFVKHGTTSRASRKVKEGQKYSQREKEIRAIAYAIKTKISKRGTQAQRFMEKSLRELGLEFQLDKDSNSMVYSVDLGEYLTPRMQMLNEKAAGRI